MMAWKSLVEKFVHNVQCCHGQTDNWQLMHRSECCSCGPKTAECKEKVQSSFYLFSIPNLPTILNKKQTTLWLVCLTLYKMIVPMSKKITIRITVVAKQTNQQDMKINCSNDLYLPSLQDFFSHIPYIINHHAHLSYFMQLFYRMTEQTLLFQDPVTLSEHQGHSNRNRIVEFSCVKHHTKFETNRFTSVPTQDNANHIYVTKITAAELSLLNITSTK